MADEMFIHLFDDPHTTISKLEEISLQDFLEILKRELQHFEKCFSQWCVIIPTPQNGVIEYLNMSLKANASEILENLVEDMFPHCL